MDGWMDGQLITFCLRWCNRSGDRSQMRGLAQRERERKNERDNGAGIKRCVLCKITRIRPSSSLAPFAPRARVSASLSD